jgi:hypothetical protein
MTRPAATRPATFGDFAAAATRSLNAVARSSGTAGPADASHDRNLGAAVRVLARYADDISAYMSSQPATGQPGQAAWNRAASRACDALHNAADTLAPPAAHARHASRSGPGGELQSAIQAMTIGRDLLHTHFSPGRGQAREPRSDWARAITSAPAACALLHQVAAWLRVIADDASRTATSTGTPMAPAVRQRLHAACQWLHVASWAIEAAQQAHPVTTADLQLLHAIPLNAVPPRHHPDGTETITALCVGIITTAARVQAAARRSAQQATWSRALTRESLRRTAEYGAITAWNTHLTLTTLAQRPDAPPGLAEPLAAAAAAADNTRQAWQQLARTWDTITTDTQGTLSPTATETGTLALWTGRLAYADPAWTPDLRPSQTTRAPGALITNFADLPAVIDAAHHASHTLASLAALTHDQVRAAAQAGRLIVPSRNLPDAWAIPYLLAPAPPSRATRALDTCRNAAAASTRAADKIAGIAAAIAAPSHVLAAIRTPLRDAIPAAPAAPASSPTPPGQLHPPPGPAERILRDLAVTSPGDLAEAAALDQAVDQLILRAATASPLAKPPDLNATPATAETITHLLAAHGEQAPAAVQPPDPLDPAYAATWTAGPQGHTVRAQLPPAVTAARQASALVRQALTAWNMPELADDAELLVSDLIAAAAEHGNTNPIGLLLRAHPAPGASRHLTCEISDTSPSPPRPRAQGLTGERGRGLAVVAATTHATSTTVYRHGKTTWFTLTTPSPGHADPEHEAGA